MPVQLCAAGVCEQTPAPAALLISELFYDAVGTDFDAFIELYGPAGTDLAGYTLVGVNGRDGTDYVTVALNGVIGQDGIFVVATPSSVFAPAADQLDAGVELQNGPDSVQLRWGSQILDALGYGTFGPTETFAGEGQAAIDVMPGHSLTRDSLFTDTDDNSIDFQDSATPTPGRPFGSAPPPFLSMRFGGSANDYAKEIAVDSQGAIILAGEFVDAVDFGGGPRGGLGLYSLLLAKYDSTGAQAWSLSFDAPSGALCDDVAVDQNDNVIYVGTFTGSIDFGGGPLISAGANDAFVAKFSKNGTYLWSKRFGGLKPDFLHGAASDAFGNILLIGSTHGSIDFGGGPLTTAGIGDIVLAKLDSNGNHLWSKRFGAADWDSGLDLCTDSFGNVLATGYFVQTVNFGGGDLVGANVADVFLLKLDPNGAHLWSKAIGSTGWDAGYKVATDASDNVLVTGEFSDSVDFGGGPLVSVGVADLFVAKYNAAGAHLWSKRFGTPANDLGRGIAADTLGNVYLTGYVSGAVDFGGGLLSGGTMQDVFAVKFDTNGAHLGSALYGTLGSDYATGLALNPAGEPFITGHFTGSIDFGDGTLTSAGNTDIFIAKPAL